MVNKTIMLFRRGFRGGQKINLRPQFSLIFHTVGAPGFNIFWIRACYVIIVLIVILLSQPESTQGNITADIDTISVCWSIT